jgi:hypothetical protein
LTIRTRAAVLRSFFRHADMRQWCSPGIAAAQRSKLARC